MRSGPASGQSFQIENDDLIVGRQPGEGGARLDDTAVSQRHLLLRPSPGACLLFDLGSSNGTAVDGADITGYPLRNGDVVKFGQAEFHFVTEDAE